MNERELYLQALDIEEPAQRVAFLNRVCTDRPELRRQLEELLQAQELAGPFLDRPQPEVGTVDRTGAFTSSATPTDNAGTVIAGRYKLLHQGGEGCLVTTLVARDEFEDCVRAARCRRRYRCECRWRRFQPKDW